MSGTSTKTRTITIRIPLDDYNKIQHLLDTSMRLGACSHSDYCRTAVLRYLHRHDVTHHAESTKD